MNYKIVAKSGRAKSATMHTVHGVIETPVFMNVGTVAAIKGAVSTDDLQKIGTQVELSNTYHLHVRTGDEIIKNNLRSGVSVNYDGNILVIGDVNAGAELVATGNIIVIGVLRGFANAGVKGDRSAMVISNKINATQLRIGQLIAIPPKDDDKKTTGVQIASIQNNKIEIQQY